MFLEAALFALSGFFMKFSDDSMDKKNNTYLGILTGIICVAGIGYLSVNYSDAATIFLAILIGTVISAKVDKIGHLATLIIFLIILFFWGIPTIGIITLVLCTLAAWLDELGNDRESLKGKKFVETFFNYRCALKVMVLVLSILGAVQMVYPSLQIPYLDFFQPVTFIYFMLFDLAYELAGIKFDRIYRSIYRT